MSFALRFVATLVVVIAFSYASIGLNAWRTIASGDLAGSQFADSDIAAIQNSIGQSFLSSFGSLSFYLMLIALLGIWVGPIRRRVSAMLTIVAFASLALLPIPSAKAYYDTTDYAEPYFILPNESAFFIPDIGANKESQTQFGSEEYLQEQKIPAKRFVVPHAKLPGSAWISNYYVPTGRLIIVDRTPYSREWVSQAHRGTSTTDQSFPCQSKEGLDVTVGIAIGAAVFEKDAARFLYRFGVKPPSGDRNKPEVIFTSVYYGRSLTEVMDGPVRSKIQALVCGEMSKRNFDQINADASPIMDAIQVKVKDYMATVGVTLDHIGWADTFTFDKAIQDVVNRTYIAGKEAVIASSLAPHAGTLQALAQAEATRTTATKWNGALPGSVSLWWLPEGVTSFLKSMVQRP
jgi:hypothetical protein